MHVLNRASSKQQRKQFWPLLKSVSRSFYLSLRYLPSSIQQSISLAYLLARLGDSIADCSVCSLNYRKEAIAQLQNLINRPDEFTSIARLQDYLLSYIKSFPNTEQTLLTNLSFLLLLLQKQSVKHLLYIQEVLNHIIEGQLIDLQFFDTHNGVTYFTKDHELDRYLYLVAGCVGEFWTKICWNAIPGYSEYDLSYLLPKAINFGKALQLTNILRDIPEDLKKGRFYLPWNIQDHPENLLNVEHFMIQNLHSDLFLLINKWHHQAINYLDDADLYIHTVKNRRIRFACLVPFYLAQKTLDLLNNKNYLYSTEKIKVQRKQVYFYLWNALLHATLLLE